MAGIEKVCEFSGEYPGWLMYGYKHNQLQIMPKYRKNFRNAKATLYLQFDRLAWEIFNCYSDYDKGEMNWYEPAFKSEKDFIEWKKSRGHKLRKKYQFCLVVEDEHLQGEVEGCYYNYTYDISTTKRKLKRLLRCKELDTVIVGNEQPLYKYIEEIV